MKKILILLAALLYIFAAEAQTKISQDSIESIQGQKVGRLRPVVSNGFYQKSSEGGDSYNQVLDTETGVPIESITTGQEALDTLSSMMSQSNYDASDAVLISRLKNGTLKAETLLPFSVNLNMADGYLRLIQLVVKNTITIDTVNVPIGTAGVFTADNENSITIYKVNATGDSINKVLASANNGDIFKTQGMVSVPMTSSYTFNKGDIIYIGATYNNSAQTTAPAIIGVYFPSCDLLQIGYTTYMSKSSITSTADSYKISELSTTSGSSAHYKFYLY